MFVFSDKLPATNGVGAPFSHSKNAGATFKKRVRAKPGMGTLKRINDQKKATKKPPKAGARNGEGQGKDLRVSGDDRGNKRRSAVD